jgi:FkbM family methyltransferase
MLDILIHRLEILKEQGFSPRTILDIGAHRGEWSRKVATVWPEASFFMIEANIDHQETLKKATWAKGFEIALLGEKVNKKVKYYVSKSMFSEGNSVFKEQTHFFDKFEIRFLPMDTLDSLVKRRKLSKIDFLKIDTQGSEINILKGAKKTLAKAEFVLLETQNLIYNLGAPDTGDVIVFMKKIGFKLFDITELHHLTTKEMLGVDMLFAKNNSKYIKKGILL